MLYYFAYGSNLHPLRLQERVSSAQLVGTTELCGYRLVFHKNGHDGSGKCNLFATGQSSDRVHGAIFTLDKSHKGLLDEFEGRGYGYIDKQLKVPHGGDELFCFTYFAQNAYIVDALEPFHWYKELVLQGAYYLDFPDAYISSIERVISVEDPDESRRHAHQALLKRMHNYPR